MSGTSCQNGKVWKEKKMIVSHPVCNFLFPKQPTSWTHVCLMPINGFSATCHWKVNIRRGCQLLQTGLAGWSTMHLLTLLACKTNSAEFYMRGLRLTPRQGHCQQRQGDISCRRGFCPHLGEHGDSDTSVTLWEGTAAVNKLGENWLTCIVSYCSISAVWWPIRKKRLAGGGWSCYDSTPFRLCFFPFLCPVFSPQPPAAYLLPGPAASAGDGGSQMAFFFLFFSQLHQCLCLYVSVFAPSQTTHCRSLRGATGLAWATATRKTREDVLLPRL